MMDLADTPRQGDLDGRGNLSERALIDFVTWFLRVALDQVTFMSELFDLDNLANRLRTFIARHERFRPEAAALLEQTLVRGEIERGEASRITAFLFGRRSACSTTWSAKACSRRRRRKGLCRCVSRSHPGGAFSSFVPFSHRAMDEEIRFSLLSRLNPSCSWSTPRFIQRRTRVR